MLYYLFDHAGFVLDTYATFTDALEELERCEAEYGWTDLFITTDPHPWSTYRANVKEYGNYLAIAIKMDITG